MRPTVVSGYTCSSRRSTFSSCIIPERRRSTSPKHKRLVVTRAANPRRPSSRNESRVALYQALMEQARKEALPWIQDLVLPWLEGPPGPLTDTLDAKDLADPDSLFLNVRGVDVHYKARKATGSKSTPHGNMQLDPDRPTLLLAHGFNGSVFSWRCVMDDLAAGTGGQGNNVVAYDRPPFGLSSRPLRWPSDDLNPYTSSAGGWLGHGLLEGLGVKAGVVVVGHSAGASVAVDMAIRYPELVSGVVLISPALASSSQRLVPTDIGQQLRLLYVRALLGTQGPGLNYVRRSVRKRSEEVRAGKLNLYHDGQLTPDDEVIEGYLRPMRARDWDRGYQQLLRSISFGGVPAYDSMRQPVLVVEGAQDRTTPPELARALHQRMLRRGEGTVCEYVELPRCGHLPMEERPQQVLEAMLPFLAKHLPPPPPPPPLPSAGAQAIEWTHSKSASG